jgi:hypothetical protein
MKRIFTLISLLFSAFVVNAQDCSELFISEYVEGSGNNKGLEIYNPSLVPVSLANYRIIRWDNGSVTADANPEGVLSLPTNITMQPKSVYVIALNLTDPSGVGQFAPIDTALQNRADTLLCPGCATGTGLPRVLCFNGDDALSLEKNVGGTWTKVDIFGSIGEQPVGFNGTANPTAGWTALPPFSSMPVGYDSNVSGLYEFQYWSQNNTLKRKYGVKTGVKTNPAPQSFNVSLEWDSLPENTFSGLGAHDCECNLLGLAEQAKLSNSKIYPNPANDFISIISKDFVGNIRIFNVMGEVVNEMMIGNAQDLITIETAGFTPGLYIVQMSSAVNGVVATASHRLVIQ